MRLVADGNGGSACPSSATFATHINYDPDTIYDSDKDINSGDYIWALTACSTANSSPQLPAEVVLLLTKKLTEA